MRKAAHHAGSTAPLAWIARALLYTAALFFLTGAATSAAEEGAGPDVASAPRTRAADAFARAERADESFAFAEALAGYEEALRLDPTMPAALRAEARARMLRERSEGGFTPLVALERVRRDPRLASDPAAIDALVKAADGFPPGVVRVEAWALAAEAYAHRLGRPDDAASLWRRVATDPAADPVLTRAALRSLATFYIERRDWAGAEAVMALPTMDAKLASEVRRAIFRHHVRLASVTTLCSVFVLATIALAGAARRRTLGEVVRRIRATSALIVGYAVYVAVVGALLASGYEQGAGLPFVLFGVALVPLLLIARAWGAAGSQSRSARALRAVLCAASVLGAAFLVLERVGRGYLEGVGL
jgi:tetratricopeptide (TPR) repeat protein